MMAPKREDIIAKTLEYFLQQYTKEKLAAAIGIDRTSITNWIQQKNTISDKKFRQVSKGLTDVIHRMPQREYDEFCEYVLKALGKDRIMIDTFAMKEKATFTQYQEFVTCIQEMSDADLPMQSIFDVNRVIAKVHALCFRYHDFFSASIQIDSPHILVLTYPKGFRLALLLANFGEEEYLSFQEKISELEAIYNLDMILIFTDYNVDLRVHGQLRDNKKVYIETIQKKELDHVKMNGNSILDIMEENPYIYAYAQLIMERLLSYQSIIKSEILFKNAKINPNKPEGTVKLYTDNHFNEYVDKILIKEILRYSYLKRHEIYYERKLVKELVEKKGGKKKVAIEICAPFAMISTALHAQFEQIHLFTSSRGAYNHLTKTHNHLEGGIFPDNVALHHSYRDPYLANEQMLKLGIEKADLVILGCGLVSRMSSLNAYLRYVNQWLADDGMLFLSMHNSESVLVKKEKMNSRKDDYSITIFPEEGSWRRDDKAYFMQRRKCYSIEELERILASYMTDIQTTTYPFMTALLNPEEHERVVLDEIRSQDKEYAKKHGRMGHYLCAIASKKQRGLGQKDHCPAMISEEVYRVTKSYIESKGCYMEVVHHAPSVDTENQYKILQKMGYEEPRTTYIKTIVLQNGNPNTLSPYSYQIIPRSYKLSVERTEYSLVPEESIIEEYGLGSISPFISLPEIQEKIGWKGKIRLDFQKEMLGEYVIFSSGLNTASIRMKSVDFVRLMEELIL